jgi:hypothetical protein
MIAARPVILIPLALLLGCSSAPIPAETATATETSGSTSSDTTGEPPVPTSSDGSSGTTGDPPPETALLVHSFGDYDLGPLQEIEPCVQWTFKNEQPLYIDTVTLANDGGFHHSNWLVVPEDVFVGEDGYFDCNARGFNELQGAVAGTVLFAQSTQSRYETQDLPDGVVVKIPPRHKLVAGVHLLNLSTADLRSELRMGLQIVHPQQVQTIVAPFRLNYQDLQIPAQKQSRFTGECILDSQYEDKSGFPLDLKLYHVLPHYHYLGNYFSVEIVGGPRDGEQIYLHTGFNADGNGLTFDPPIDLTGAKGLRFSCGYDNWRDKDIGYGIGDQEMCVMLGLADMRVMMNASVDSGSKMVGADGEVLLHEGPCSTIAIPKNASQAMPTASELAAPLYIPPSEPGDVDLDPVKKCVDIPDDATPLAPATLASLRETIFNPTCTFSSCHGGKTPISPRLDGADLHAQLLATADQTKMPRIDPGKPENSWLYRLVSQCEPRDADDHVFTHMPYNAPTLLEPRLAAKLRAWIEAGAPAE